MIIATELIQTEINHVRTLKLVLGVYVREVRETLQLDETRMERLFPQVENLLQIHQFFLNRLKQRRIESMEAGSGQNYCIHRIGDILVEQVCGFISQNTSLCFRCVNIHLQPYMCFMVFCCLLYLCPMVLIFLFYITYI